MLDLKLKISMQMLKAVGCKFRLNPTEATKELSRFIRSTPYYRGKLPTEVIIEEVAKDIYFEAYFDWVSWTKDEEHLHDLLFSDDEVNTFLALGMANGVDTPYGRFLALAHKYTQDPVVSYAFGEYINSYPGTFIPSEELDKDLFLRKCKAIHTSFNKDTIILFNPYRDGHYNYEAKVADILDLHYIVPQMHYQIPALYINSSKFPSLVRIVPSLFEYEMMVNAKHRPIL